MLSGMNHLKSKSLRTKFILVFGTLFIFSTLIPHILTLYMTFQSLKDSDRSEVKDKTAELISKYKRGGLNQIKKTVETDNTLGFDRPYSVRIAEMPGNNTIFSFAPKKWDEFDFKRLSEIDVPPFDTFSKLKTNDVSYAIDFITHKLTGQYIIQIGSSTKMRQHVITSSIRTFLVVIIPSTIILLVLVWVFTSAMLQPVFNILSVVRQVIQTGKYNQKIPFRKSARELEELVHFINQMFSKLHLFLTNLKETLETIAHDIRTPMTRIRTRAEIAVNGNADASEMEKALYACIQESETVSSRLQLILDASDAESGLVKIEPKRIDLAMICKDIAELYEYVADTKDVSITTDIPQTLEVQADNARMQQAVGNIMDNAVKYTQPNTEIHISLYHNREGIHISIKDRGKGIPEEMSGDIWKPRFSTAGNDSARGYGLGLTIVKAVIEAHEGTVNVKNRNNGGSDFSLTLPLSRGISL